MSILTPKEDKFYDLFIDSAHIIYDASLLLRDLMKDLSNIDVKVKEIEDMEHKGDRQVHDIMEQLNKTFITPIDREDIYDIAKQLDDILDFIEATAHRFVMFNVKTAQENAIVLGDMIVDSCKEVINLMEELKIMKKSKKLTEKIIEINRLEDEGDKIYRTAITTMFSGDMPAIEVLKWREIYEYIEQTLDACEDVANTVEGIVMKHA